VEGRRLGDFSPGSTQNRCVEPATAVGNVDSTLILAEPKIGPHAATIQKRVADLLGIKPNQVGIKAKTPEGMGTDNAAIAHVAVLLVAAAKARRKPAARKASRKR